MRKAHHTWLQPSTFLVSLIIKDLIFCPLRSSRCFWWCCLIRGQNLLRTNSLLQWNVTYVTFTWERSIPDDKMPKFVSLHRQYGGCLSTSYLSANMVFLVRCCFVVCFSLSLLCAGPCVPLLLKIAHLKMKHALKVHVPVCLYALYRIRILWLYHVQHCTVIYLKIVTIRIHKPCAVV